MLGYGDDDDPAPLDPADIALPIRIGHRGAELHFFNTITTFGAAFDITLEELAVEAYFPADDPTARFVRARPPAERGGRLEFPAAGRCTVEP
ncbi:hypothetical protein [Actinomadura sp. CNU-125]|uniref:hypothetical protein n=1 Tax=Actinomadura sp. CNU-125 TaxID=1904961 RepID=UPI003967AFB6